MPDDLSYSPNSLFMCPFSIATFGALATHFKETIMVVGFGKNNSCDWWWIIMMDLGIFNKGNVVQLSSFCDQKRKCCSKYETTKISISQ